MKKIVLIIILLAVIVGAAGGLWKNQRRQKFEPGPSWVEFVAKKTAALSRLDNFSGRPMELTWDDKQQAYFLTSASAEVGLKASTSSSGSLQMFLEKGQLIVKQNDHLIWQSPEQWWVDSFSIADADNQHNPELALSVWKQGSFGSAHPFWQTKPDQNIENHFFLYKLISGQLVPVWQSSALEQPNCEFLFADVKGSGQQELVVLEGEYNNNFQCTGNFVAVWQWNSWGFTNLWRSQKGQYANLRLSQNGTSGLVILNSLP